MIPGRNDPFLAGSFKQSTSEVRPGEALGEGHRETVHHRDARGTFTQCDVILLVTVAILQAFDMHMYYLSSQSTISSHLLTLYNSVGIR